MKQALSARYGGLLVDAHECDYLSFKHLHLLCPNCKKTVFLVGEKQLPAHTRKLKKDGEEKIIQVKGSEVGSYFAHHPDVSASAVEACELRVRSMSEIEKVRIKTESKRQLVKTLQAHFWKILKSNPYIDNLDHASGLMRNLWIECCFKRDRNASCRMYRLLLDRIAQQFKHSSGQWDAAIEQFLFESLETDNFYEQSYEEEWDYLAKTSSVIDRIMHKAIMLEILAFLSQPRQMPILQSLIEMFLFFCVEEGALRLAGIPGAQNGDAVAYDVLRSRKDSYTAYLLKSTTYLLRMDGKEFEILFKRFLYKMVAFLGFIDWAGQYEKYHNEDLAKGKATA
jgi:hypothetical protein